jgi:O-methyltransferase involved in polyketide biosynthesis
MTKVTPKIADVTKTMLWTLHNRASEAKRDAETFYDRDAIRIYNAIDYDFERSFGTPDGSHAARAAAIDHIVREWLERHPDGFVVSLGEGLETQVRRVDNGRMRWLSVDRPEAILLREHFLLPTDRFLHHRGSAFDQDWMDRVDPSSGVFVVAQGLFMYFEPEEVHRLLLDITRRFPGSEIVFDAIPRWFSRLTMRGLNRTKYFRLPPMPWGINRDEIEPTLKTWDLKISSVRLVPFRMPSGLPKLIETVFLSIPLLRGKLPSIVHITTISGI